jgi:hypothetical protein
MGNSGVGAPPDAAVTGTRAETIEGSEGARERGALNLGDSETRRRWDLVAIAVAVAPFVVAAVTLLVGVRGDYLPVGDNALIELQTRDVGRHDVLVGLYSREDWNHPGPMLFYVLAPFYWLTGGASIGMNLGTLVINGASVVGMGLIARRRGGTVLLLCTLLGSALVMRSLSAEFLRDPWNCFVTALPFGLMIFLTWALMCGEAWALPVATVVASFLAQTHVGFVILALPLLLWGTVWLVVRQPRDRFPELLRPGAAAVALGGLLWLPVALNVVGGGENNLRNTVNWFRHTDEPTHTVGEGWRVVTGQFTLQSEWLLGKQPAGFVGQSPYIYRSAIPWLLALVVVAGVGLWRSRRSDRRWLVLALAATMAVSILAVVRTAGPAFDYRLRWTWMLPVAVFVLVLWAGWQVVAERWSAPVAHGFVVAVAAALVVVSAVNVSTAATAGVPVEAGTIILDEVTPEVVAALDSLSGGRRDGQVVVEDPFARAAGVARGLVLQLERRGIDARVAPDRSLLYGDHRVVDDGPILARLFVTQDDGIDPFEEAPNMRLVADWHYPGPEPSAEEAREVEELKAAVIAGRITPDEYGAAVDDLDIPSAPPIAGEVAVFLDEAAT